MKQAHLDRKTHPVAVHRAVDTRPNSPRFGCWWLAGCVTLALGNWWVCSRWRGPAKAPATPKRSGDQSNRNDLCWPACPDAGLLPSPACGRGAGGEGGGNSRRSEDLEKLTLLAETRWDDGTRDDINIETLQSPEWIKQHDVRIGGMFRFRSIWSRWACRAIHATVIAVERARKLTPALAESC